jgi:hypothetical protein
MNTTGKFLVSALLVHAANLKKAGETQQVIPVPHSIVPAAGSNASQSVSGK